MKLFNIFILVSLLLIFGGFIFLRDSISLTQSKFQPSMQPNFDQANYLNFSAAALAASQKQGQTLLFFAATTWCQTCSELEKEILSRSSEVPSAVTILKVDYDNDQVMNRKYAVTSQHTLVLLDTNGKEVRRWMGGDFNTMIQQIGKI